MGFESGVVGVLLGLVLAAPVGMAAPGAGGLLGGVLDGALGGDDAVVDVVGTLDDAVDGLAGASEATATAEPSIARAGTTVRLTLTVSGEDSVLDQLGRGDVVCTVTRPDGTEDRPCGSGGDLVDGLVEDVLGLVALEPDTWSESWGYRAPAVPGVYTVRFEQPQLLAGLIGTADGARTASTTFTVIAATSLSPGGGDGSLSDPAQASTVTVSSPGAIDDDTSGTGSTDGAAGASGGSADPSGTASDDAGHATSEGDASTSPTNDPTQGDPAMAPGTGSSPDGAATGNGGEGPGGEALSSSTSDGGDGGGAQAARSPPGGGAGAFTVDDLLTRVDREDERMLVSTMMALGALVLLLVARRWPVRGDDADAT